MIRPALLGGGFFPSYCVYKALLRVKTTFITGAAALRCGYRSSLKTLSLNAARIAKVFMGLVISLLTITDNIKNRGMVLKTT